MFNKAMTIEHRRMIVSSLANVGVSRVISEGIVEQLDSSPAVADAPPRRAQLIGSGISRQRVSWRICPVADEDSAPPRERGNARHRAVMLGR
jgi:hypothetical protein